MRAPARTATYSNLFRFFDPDPQKPMENRRSALQVVRFARKKRDTSCIGRGHCAPIVLSQLNTQNSYRTSRNRHPNLNTDLEHLCISVIRVTDEMGLRALT